MTVGKKTIHEQLDELSKMIRQIRDGKRRVEITSERDEDHKITQIRFEYIDED